MLVKCNIFLKIVIAFGFIVLLYYTFLSDNVIKVNYFNKDVYKNVKFISPIKKPKQHNVWLIFTKVHSRSALKYKFRDLIDNLLNVTSVPIKFNIIVDQHSQSIAEEEISNIVTRSNILLPYSFYDVEDCANKIQDIVGVMTPHFSSKPGTYYSGALFYISLGLHRIAPAEHETAVLLDCDLYFKQDVALLFNEFNRFKPTALFGLAPELTPVYRHVLHTYKTKHNTTFGDYYHKSNVSESVHPRGFQGYNSGVVLVNLKALRESVEFTKIISNSTVTEMTIKYRFRGHLGDQDFYTLIGFEYPHLIQTINCGFNRQLCTWWRDHGYSDVFDFYFKCEHPIVVLHGNCNTKIPK